MIESGLEEFVHQNSVLSYPSTEDLKSGVQTSNTGSGIGGRIGGQRVSPPNIFACFLYHCPKQYIIVSIVLLHHNIYDCSIVSDPLVSTLLFTYGH